MNDDKDGGKPAKEAWDEVAERFTEIGHRIAERHRSLGEERRSPGAPQDRKKLEEALDTVTRQLDQVFTSVGDALRDPEERQRMRDAARSLASALTTTFSQVARGIGERKPD
jgi:DNA-binding ferritin-like protein